MILFEGVIVRRLNPEGESIRFIADDENRLNNFVVTKVNLDDFVHGLINFEEIDALLFHIRGYISLKNYLNFRKTFFAFLIEKKK